MATFMNPSDLARQLKPDQKKKPLAVLLQGRFKSAFSAAPEGMPSSGFLQEGEQDAAVVLMADVDFLHDSNAVETIPFINQLIVRPRNDNINLLVNSAEFLGGNQDLISIRSSGTVQRPFTKVRELQQQAQERWQSEEEKLSEQLNQLQDKLGELQSQRTDGNRTMLSAEQQSEIQKFREQEAEIRTARRHVRKKLREDIESLGHYLVAINLMVVPSIVSGLGIFMFWRREKRAKGEK
jgi:ABC-type uncharacterized transport system involved in gliding motility auxiliary subunit